MSFRITFKPLERERWSELYATPIEDLRGMDGLWDAGRYLLGTSASFEFGQQKVAVPEISLISRAFDLPYMAKVLLKRGEVRQNLSGWGPYIAARLDGSVVHLSFHAFTQKREEFAKGLCTEKEFVSELQLAGEQALEQLRNGMKGEFAPILDEWMVLASQYDPAGVDDIS